MNNANLRDILIIRLVIFCNIKEEVIITTKKIKRSIIVLSAFVFISVSGIAFASNDNYGFHFNLRSGHRNSYTKPRYRQTSNQFNEWKVNLKFNSEGDGTKATFWLAKNNKSRTLVSLTHDVKQGTGAHYYVATAGASRTYGRLGGENNNYAPCRTAGFWDEETD